MVALRLTVFPWYTHAHSHRQLYNVGLNPDTDAVALILSSQPAQYWLLNGFFVPPSTQMNYGQVMKSCFHTRPWISRSVHVSNRRRHVGRLFTAANDVMLWRGKIVLSCRIYYTKWQNVWNIVNIKNPTWVSSFYFFYLYMRVCVASGVLRECGRHPERK